MKTRRTIVVGSIRHVVDFCRIMNGMLSRSVTFWWDFSYNDDWCYSSVSTWRPACCCCSSSSSSSLSLSLPPPSPLCLVHSRCSCCYIRAQWWLMADMPATTIYCDICRISRTAHRPLQPIVLLAWTFIFSNDYTAASSDCIRLNSVFVQCRFVRSMSSSWSINMNLP